MPLVIAMCQTFVVDGDREGNFRRIEYALEAAKAKGAQLACFPESALLGWVNPEAHQLAYPIPGADSDRICDLARKYGMMICIGLEEKDGDRLYGSVILVSAKGELLAKHRKINVLPELMTPPYTPGNVADIKAVGVDGRRIGLLVCADTFMGDALKKMAQQKPDLVLVPYGWAAEKEKWPGHGQALKDTVCKAAQAIGAPVIGTDCVGLITHGPWTGRTYGGESVAADAAGNVLAVGRDRDEDVVMVKIPAK